MKIQHKYLRFLMSRGGTISLRSIKYFYTLSIKREWTLKFIRQEREKSSPDILCKVEVAIPSYVGFFTRCW
jgi:hypothetical protein